MMGKRLKAIVSSLSGDEKETKGFTILEVILAISLLSIGLLAIANMQIMAIQKNSFARWQTEQTTYAQDKMEELWALAFTHADLDPAGNPHNEASPPANLTITWNVADDTTTFPVPDTKLITITVTGTGKSTVLTGVKPNF